MKGWKEGGEKGAASTQNTKKKKKNAATKKYKVTFLPSGKTIEVDPEKIPYGHNGLPGSFLDISEGIKAALDHPCRGVCASPTFPVSVPHDLHASHGSTYPDPAERHPDLQLPPHSP